MSGIPAFLRKPMPVSDRNTAIRCGSFAMAAQGAPWAFALMHDRPENLLLWITRGQGRVVINGVRRGVSMNNALYLPAGTLFSLDLSTGVQALLVESPAGLTGRLPRDPMLIRVRDSLAQAELTAEIDAMRRELHAGRPRTADALEAHVRLLSVWLHRQEVAGAADTPRETAAQRLVQRFAQRVVRHHRSAQNLSDHADALDVTPTHLTRVCRQCCGRTAADILTERKLHAARRALEAGTPAIKQIAQDLGFASAAYFTRFIQTKTGKTPSALRAAACGRT